MKVTLTQKPRNVTIIEGFPGFGLVGTITTEFLIKHLNAKPIGEIASDKLLPVAAVHNAEIIEPIGIYYDKTHSLVIIHVLSGVQGLEWQLSKKIMELAKLLNAKEIVSIEGIGSAEKTTRGFFYTKNKERKKHFEKIGLTQLKEGIVMGVTGALLLRANITTSCIFVESHVSIADSKAAAKIVEILDKYMNLNIDYKPLLKTAEEFETKLKTMIEKGKQAPSQHTLHTNQALNYMG